MELENLKIVVLYGGWSDETDYTAHEEVKLALKNNKVNCTMITVNDKDWIKKITKINPDVVFITNQGNYGEDGRVQAVLDMLDIKYIGSGVLPSSIGMNKYFFKLYIEKLGIKTPKYILHKYKSKNKDFFEIVDYLSLPFIIKPVSNGASMGISLINSEKEYLDKINLLEERYGDLLFEEFISHPKKELGVGIIEKEGIPIVLPTCIIEYKDDFFSNKIKFSGENVKKYFIKENENEIIYKASEITKKIHIELGCSGLSRVDFILNSNDELYVLEINTLPGLLKNSLFPKSCKEIGLTYEKMVELLILSAYNRKPFNIAKLT